MDFDDFQFQPITKGLGFDKQAERVKHQIIESAKTESESLSVPFSTLETKTAVDTPVVDETTEYAPVSRSLRKMLDSLPPSMDFINDIDRTEGLRSPQMPIAAHARQEPVAPARAPSVPAPPVQHPRPEAPQPAPARKDYDVTLNNSIAQAFPKIEFQKSFFHQTVTPQKKFKEIPASLTSAIIDGFVTVGITGCFLVILIALTEIDLMKIIGSQQAALQTLGEAGVLYLGVTAVYFMIARSLYGSTLGDWAFDVQLGSQEQRLHIMYPFQTLFRAVVILLTGVVIVPLVSLGFGKDIAEKFSGLKLYLRQY